jgi:CDP-diacylglycerol--serine O-phosphatidyltransferase
MVGLSFLMISNVRYAAVPVIGYRSLREILGTLVVVGTLVGVVFLPKPFFFPALMAYVIYGVLRTVFEGLLARRRDDYGMPLDDEEVAIEGGPVRRRRRRRRTRSLNANPNPPEEPLE